MRNHGRSHVCHDYGRKQADSHEGLTSVEVKQPLLYSIVEGAIETIRRQHLGPQPPTVWMRSTS